MIILGIILYLIVGILFATITYFRLLSEDGLPEEKWEIVIVMLICLVFWIIIMPGTIYNTIKGGKNNG